jgi:ketosteroid isomerase-like protein
MKKLLLLFGIIVFVAGCKTTSDSTDKQLDKTAKKNMEIVKEFFKAVEDEDIGKLEELFADDFHEIGPGHKEEYNREQSIESFKKFFEMNDSIRFGIAAISTEHKAEGELSGDWVMTWNWFEMNHVDQDKDVKLMYHAAFRIEEGKIALLANYLDRWDFYKQLGYELEWEDEDEEEEQEDDN